MIMFKLGKYYNTNSLIHNLNPFIKLFLSIIFIISVFLAKSLMANLLLTAFLLIMIVSSDVPANEYFKSIWFMKYFLILIFLMDLLFFKSFIHVFLSMLSMILIILMTSLVIFTTKIRDLTMALEIFLTPLKLFGLNPKKIAFTMTLSIRFIPILLNESKNIIKAMKNRNFKDKESFKDKINNAINVINPLFNKSLEHADRLADMMTIRNYSFDKKERYVLYTRKFDYALVTTQLLLFIAIILKG